MKEMKKISFNFKEKRVEIKARTQGYFGKIFGLMFKRRKKARALIFEFKKPVKLRIHSLFVFFSFIAVWVDDRNKIVDIMVVRPFTPAISPKTLFTRLIEIPVNKEYMGTVKLLVGD